MAENAGDDGTFWVAKMKKITPETALYIKLGRNGSWEEECVKTGIIRFGYKETPFDAAIAGDWEAVKQYWLSRRTTAGAATRDVSQIRNYFEADENVLWITFYAGRLWWCFAKPGVINHTDGKGSYRETVNGWSDKDIDGRALNNETISGNLLRVQAFRGTVCEVRDFEYLVRKINASTLPQVEAAAQAQSEMIKKIVPLIKLLSWQDFELLVDLVFASSGWRRIGHLGKTQKTVDIELLLPTTGERAFVQIKSSSNNEEFLHYSALFKKNESFGKMFYVWHSGHVDQADDAGEDDIICIGPDQLARMVFDAGLTSWLLGKVS